jgi:hypothetical protein
LKSKGRIVLVDILLLPQNELMMRWTSSEYVVSTLSASLTLIVYVLTAYPGIAFWDSGEWIISCYSLQIPHAPGAPLYSLIGRVFAMAGSSEPDAILVRINLFSSVAASLTVFFFSRLVYALAQYLIDQSNRFQQQVPNQLSLIAAFLGGLTLGFSDTFWRNATEAEVYALSACLFTSSLLYSWKYVQKGNIRYFLLSCFLTGSSLCVHPTNILVIPLVSAGWIYRNQLLHKVRIIYSLISWILVNLALSFWFMEGLPAFAVWWDVQLAGNSGLGLSPGIGIAIAWILPIMMILIALQWIPKIQTPMMALVFLQLGLVFYALIPLRSDAPMKLGAGPDAAGFKSYYTRADFGKAPVVLGKSYQTSSNNNSNAYWLWDAKNKQYHKVPEYGSPDKNDHNKFFPRMHSTLHSEAYNQWRKKNGYSLTEKPDLSDELHYLFSEQLGKHFFRYLGWNLIGRRSDQPESSVMGVIPQSISPRGAMPLFFLPLSLLILGALAVFIHCEIISIFIILGFLLTGPLLAIVVNLTPDQVRERDYVFQFCLIFCFLLTAMAPIALAQLIPTYHKKWLNSTLAFLLLIPGVQVTMGIPSHQKSANNSALVFATLLLESCPQNSLLFTAGDNDTFPLWCAQELKGIRRDVTILNLNLLQQPWYYRRLKKPHQIGHYQLNSHLPDSLDFKPVLHVEIDEMDKLNSLLRSKSWQAPAIWLRYQYLLAKILGEIEQSQRPQVVAFSPICQSRDLMNLREFTQLDGMARYLYFNWKDSTNRGAYHFLQICRNQPPWNPDQLNFTERSFHKLVRKKGLMHARSLQSPPQTLQYLKWLEYFAPADLKSGAIHQNLEYASLLDSCGASAASAHIFAYLALQSAQQAHSPYSQELNCQEIQDIEFAIQKKKPFFRIEEHWFPEKYPHPCLGK